jgi:putative sugar O-methyltransferase
MQDYPELTQMRQDMLAQNELYRPTAFWDAASAAITSGFEEQGVETFRRQQKPMGFFAPTFGVPGNSFKAAEVERLTTALGSDNKKAALGLEQFLNGEMSALADYRVLLAADDASQKPFLHHFSESTAGAPVEQFEFDGRKFSRSALNYLLGLAMLKRHLKGDEIRTVLEIGGGFGTLGEVLASAGIEGLRYVDIDIPPTAFAAQWYLQQALGEENVGTYSQTKDRSKIDIESLPQTSVLCAWQIEKLRGKVDLFVNFISFQEMEPPVVKNYMSHVARLGTRWVLLRNMREGKQKRSAAHQLGCDDPVKGDDYLAMLPGYELVDRNVHPFGYRTVDGFHSELQLFRRTEGAMPT